MIRLLKASDKSSLIDFLMKKMSLSFKDAETKANELLRGNNTCFLKESPDVHGICWVETVKCESTKIKKLSFLVDNWKLAEDFIKLLRWNLNGEYIIEVPKHDFLNRTLSKNGFRFLRLNDNKNVYNYRFEKKTFTNYKLDDID